MGEQQTAAATGPYMLTIEGSKLYSGLTTNRLYDAINAGQIDARQIGRRTMVMGDSLRAFCAALPKVTMRPKPGVKKAA